MTKESFEVAVGDFYEMTGRVAEQYGRFWEKNVIQPSSAEDPAGSVLSDFSAALQELGTAMLENPNKVLADQLELMQKQQELYQYTVMRYLGQTPDPVVAPDPTDRRFKDDEWEENPLFDYLKQLYLLQGNSLMQMIKDTDGLDEHTRQKVEYFVRQYVNAMSPTNFPSMNPAVIHKTMETNGANLATGIEQLMKDMEGSAKGLLNVAMTDTNAFEVGNNIAVTKGKVVYQNDLMQLIQYAPTTEKVFKRPLLIIPPFINKYYILDLRQDNSFVKWLADQGHTVFCISWVNATPALRNKNFEDYMLEGPIAAVEAIQKATGEKDVNAIGYCVGGTLLSATQAYLKKKRKAPIKTNTFLTTLTDFSEPGEIGVFINETAISALERQMDVLGFYDGRQMAFSFNTLRENDLFWSFFVNNYLLGERPAAFDLLYWNTDSTNLPAAMHSYYLRNMYLYNKLIEPNALEMDGVKIDLSKITVPSYFISCAQDHIALWRGTYKGAQVLGGDKRFVLGGSGHIAGIVNPPHKKKYGYWTNDSMPLEADDWYADAKHNEGSWWLDWQQWIEKQGGMTLVDARQPGSDALPPIEDAPGTYASTRIEETLK